jgi:hypothetical protein
MLNIFRSIDITLAKIIGNPTHAMPLEGLLRPKLEYITAALALLSSIFFFKGGIFLSDSYGAVAGAFFLGFAILRFYQGRYLSIYHQYIKKLPKYKITVKELYYYVDNRDKDEKVFIGTGYRWTPQHTQRFYDLEAIQEFIKYTDQSEDNPLGGKPHIHGVGGMNEISIYSKILIGDYYG